MYCLDSNIIIENLKDNKYVVSKLKEIANIKLFITPISVCELYRGAFLSKNSENNINLITNFLKSVQILDFDDFSCREYGRKYAELKSIGKLTQDFDLLIAAICISNNKILVTNNKKHFENIKGLKVEEW